MPAWRRLQQLLCFASPSSFSPVSGLMPVLRSRIAVSVANHIRLSSGDAINSIKNQRNECGLLIAQ
jgi:hypothetical protein